MTIRSIVGAVLMAAVFVFWVYLMIDQGTQPDRAPTCVVTVGETGARPLCLDH